MRGFVKFSPLLAGLMVMGLLATAAQAEISDPFSSSNRKRSKPSSQLQSSPSFQVPQPGGSFDPLAPKRKKPTNSEEDSDPRNPSKPDKNNRNNSSSSDDASDGSNSSSDSNRKRQLDDEDSFSRSRNRRNVRKDTKTRGVTHSVREQRRPGWVSRPSQSQLLSGISAQILVSSGCSVVATAGECVSRPYQGSLRLMPVSRDRVTRIKTDEQGSFQVRLAPGVYIIEPESITPAAFSSEFVSQTIRVVPGIMRSEKIVFTGLLTEPGAPNSPNNASISNRNGQTNGGRGRTFNSFVNIGPPNPSGDANGASPGTSNGGSDSGVNNGVNNGAGSSTPSNPGFGTGTQTGTGLNGAPNGTNNGISQTPQNNAVPGNTLNSAPDPSGGFTTNNSGAVGGFNNNPSTMGGFNNIQNNRGLNPSPVTNPGNYNELPANSKPGNR